MFSATGDLSELLEKAEMEDVPGITETSGKGMRRSTSLVSFSDIVKVEEVDNFTVTLKKGERYDTWYTPREMQVLKFEELEIQVAKKELDAAEQKQNTKSSGGMIGASLTRVLSSTSLGSKNSNSSSKAAAPPIERDPTYNPHSRSRNSNSNASAKSDKKRSKQKKSWTKKAKGLFSSSKKTTNTTEDARSHLITKIP